MRITYTRAPDYHVTTVNGIWGVVSPNGELVVDLYLERLGMPSDHDAIPLDGVGAGLSSSQLKTEYIARESQVGLVLTPEVARMIGSWLIANVDQAVTNREQSVLRHPSEAKA